MDILNAIGTIRAVYQEQIHLDEPFIDFASHFAETPGTVCLMSGGALDCARYHMLATRPFLFLSGKGRIMELRSEMGAVQVEADPFDMLRLVLDHFDSRNLNLPDPVSAGLFGYLAYDMKDHIERLPRTSIDDLHLPSLYMTAPSIVVIEDKIEGWTRLFLPDFGQGVEAARIFFDKTLCCRNDKDPAFTSSGAFHSNFDQPAYMDTIHRIREYIAAGDIYQVNMSQRFETDFAGSPFGLFMALYRNNPAPFFAFVNADDHAIISTSPERFVQRNKERVETRPIKGTRPRGTTVEQDARLRQALAQSPKDDAELSMIVDLMRNDIGKVCEGGSVTVREHKRVEAYANVYHLISIVDGLLDPSVHAVDLIRATFPGGSITGCPKIRSMEIIDELETRRRHIYTGSIGYISFHETLDLSIAIRTATILGDRLVFSVGGGVVFDSDPDDEYHETLHKGRTLLDTLSGKTKSTCEEARVWINGGLKPMGQAGIPLSDTGVQYGHGFFETLRADCGKIRYLDEHITRLEKAWNDFFPQPFPELSWDLIIAQVLGACRLNGCCAAVKIMVTRGSRDRAPWDNTLVVMARPYTHRLEVLGKPGLDLITWDQRRQTFLADYKSINYQYGYLAGLMARQKGGDEALILNVDGSLSETSTANILIVRNRQMICPASPHVLGGVMEKAVTTLLQTWGYSLTRRLVFASELGGTDQVIVTNSLMGAVPVLSMDGKMRPDASALCLAINQALFD